MQPGAYAIAVTWQAADNLSATVQYAVYDGSKLIQQMSVDQQYAPDDFTDQGVAWRGLGTFTITGSSLHVAVCDSASDGPVCADAVRLVPVTALTPVGIMHVTSANFQQEVIQSKAPVLVDFYADWCEYCQQEAPILQQLARDQPGVKIVKINIDESPALAAQYNIQAIPDLFVFDNGKQAGSSLGLQTESQLLSLLNA